MAEERHGEVVDIRKGPGCLNLEALDEAAAGAGPPENRQHVAHCSYCQTELALLREFTEASPATPDEAAAVSGIEQQLKRNAPWRADQPEQRGWLPSWLSWPAAGLSTAVVALAVVTIVMLSRSQLQPLPEPIDSTPGALRAAGIAEITPLGDLAAAPALLRWGPVAGAAQYRVRLLDVDQAAVWTANAVSGAELPIPVPAQALMLPLKTMFWQIEALDTEGRPIATSRMERFRVLPHGR